MGDCSGLDVYLTGGQYGEQRRTKEDFEGKISEDDNMIDMLRISIINVMDEGNGEHAKIYVE